jgi:SWI/SNF-related matrix-associated actin-dependent regulator 1 of chromatin subfamily A
MASMTGTKKQTKLWRGGSITMGMTTEELQKFLQEHPGIQSLENQALVVEPAVKAWNSGLCEDASRALDSNIEIPAPAGLEYYGFQKAGIEYASKRAMTLVADEQGLGKTLEGVGLSNLLPEIKKVLIVCPASLKINWKREWEKWDVKDLHVEIVKKQFLPADVYVLNYDILKKWRKEVREIEWDLLIADEAHFLRSVKAQRTREVLGGIKRDAKKTIVERISPIPAKRRLFLTGTPLNKPKELWPMLQVLDPNGLGANWYSYAKRYCGLWEIKDRTGKRIGWKWDGATNLEELQERLRASFMVRRLKKDVLTSLPPKIRQVISIEPSSSLKKLIATEILSYEKYKDTLENNQNPPAFSAMAQIRKEVGIAKVPFCVEHIKEILNEREKIVIFGHHHSVLDKLQEAFGESAVRVDGRTPLDERQRSVDRFQTDPTCHIFIGGVQAAGTGITLTASSTVVFVELDWTPGNVSQAEDRCHRIGQKDCVTVQHIVLAGSLDERLAAVVIEKQGIIDAALDTEK